MEEPTTNPTPTEPTGGSNIQIYLDQIQKLKSESVPRDEYEKLAAERTTLLQRLVDGDYGQPEPESKPAPNLGEMRESLYSANGEFEGNDLSYMEQTLKLRQAIMDQGGIDPFVPIGSRFSPTPEDFTTAAKAAEVFQHCVDYAEGDNEVFVNELQRLTTDTPIVRRR